MAAERAARHARIMVELRGLDLHRGGRSILRDIHWRIAPGQRWVVIGANGAGKTQLLKIVAGAVWPDPVPAGAAAPRRYRWQGRWHDDTLDVQSVIEYLGPERQDRYARYDWNFSLLELVGTGQDRADIPQRALTSRRRAQAERLLGQFGLRALAGARILEMSSGERRLALVARALASGPALLLLDETLTHLDAGHQARLLDWLGQTAADRPAWALSTHRRDHIPASASHALVLRAGRAMAAGPIDDPAVRRALTRVLGPAQSRKRNLPPALRRGTAPRRRSRVRLSVRQGELWLENALILRDIELRLGAGECWVLTGANGSGKTTLLRALYGDFPFALGSRVDRTGVRPREPLQNFRQRCGFVAPQLQTDYPRNATVLDTVASGWDASYGLNEPASAAVIAAARRALQFWGAASWAGRRLQDLSYGQVRRVLFARAWIREPQVLLLDEPFAGLDVRQRRLLSDRIEQALGQGVAVLMSSHHPDEQPRHPTGVLQIVGQRLVRR
jgi:molybdate transport system ATP-binding protein